MTGTVTPADLPNITTVEEARHLLEGLVAWTPGGASATLATTLQTARNILALDADADGSLVASASVGQWKGLLCQVLNAFSAEPAPQPEPEPAAVNLNCASEKQVAFARRLAAQKDVPADERNDLDVFLSAPHSVTKRQAGLIIDGLLGYPDKPQAGGVEEDGMYRDANGNIFKVQRSQAGRLYAKALVADESKKSGWAFEYAAGAVRRLSPAMRMTVEQAKEFGALYGTCCVCGRTLTDEASIAAGIGPICAGKV